MGTNGMTSQLQGKSWISYNSRGRQWLEEIIVSHQGVRAEDL
jgi:hypothetical protein